MTVRGIGMAKELLILIKYRMAIFKHFFLRNHPELQQWI